GWQPQVPDQVAYLGLAEEVRVGAHAEWQPCRAQSQRRGSSLSVGAIQDADFAGVFDLARVQQAMNFGSGKVGLVVFVGGRVPTCARPFRYAGSRLESAFTRCGVYVVRREYAYGRL